MFCSSPIGLELFITKIIGVIDQMYFIKLTDEYGEGNAYLSFGLHDKDEAERHHTNTPLKFMAGLEEISDTDKAKSLTLSKNPNPKRPRQKWGLFQFKKQIRMLYTLQKIV